MALSKRSAIFIYFGAIFSIGLLFALPYRVSATETDLDWINGTVSATKTSDFLPAEGEIGRYGNIPCYQVTADSWSWQSNGWSSWKVRSTQSECAAMGSNGYIGFRRVLPFGSKFWQPLNLSNYSNPWMLPNPGTNGLGFVTNFNSGFSELYYTPDVFSLFKTYSTDGLGNVVRSADRTFERKLTYPDGRPLGLTGVNGISYSANGKWMYLNVNGVGQLRIATEDFSVFSFSSGFTPQYAMHTAISNSGNTVVTHQYNGQLKLFDLTRCDAEKPDYAPRQCVFRDLMQDLRDAVTATLADASKLRWIDVSDVEFLNESELRLLVHYVYDNQEKYMFVSMKTAAAEQPVRYLALGDSFSSGEGAGNYYEATNFYANANNYNFCHQSRVAYSELLNSWLRPEFYDSIACSGAQMKDVVYMGSDDDYIKYGPPQSRRSSSNELTIQYARQLNLPGYTSQLSLLTENTPTIATLSIGGNDIGFKDIIMSCVMNNECYSSRDDREKLADLIASKISKLAVTFANIKQNMTGLAPKLYVLGYPRLFAERGCGQFMGIEEQAFANHLVDYLDDAIRLAAARAGVFYVDVSQAFYDGTEQGDHRLCSKAAPAANGVFYDKNNTGQGQSLLDGIFRALVSSYHPNTLGHQLLAGAIRQQTAGFGAVMPFASATSERPAQTLYSALVGDTSDVYQELGNVTQGIMKDVIVEAGQDIDVTYSLGLNGEGLPVESATITVVAQSTPITLGTLSVQPDGTASGSFALPSSLESGVHTIHLLYTDISGQVHDIYQYVYLIASETDFDGDSVPNSQEVCALGNAIGVDRNANGLDDACDSDTFTSKITEPKVATGPAAVYVPTPQGHVEESLVGFGWPYDISATLSHSTPKVVENIENIPANLSSDNNREDSSGGLTIYVYLTFGIIVLGCAALYLIKHERF